MVKHEERKTEKRRERKFQMWKLPRPLHLGTGLYAMYYTAYQSLSPRLERTISLSSCNSFPPLILQYSGPCTGPFEMHR